MDFKFISKEDLVDRLNRFVKQTPLKGLLDEEKQLQDRLLARRWKRFTRKQARLHRHPPSTPPIKFTLPRLPLILRRDRLIRMLKDSLDQKIIIFHA